MNKQNASEDLLSGQAWNDFCDRLKQAGELVQRENAAKDPLSQAEGYRYLTRMLRAGLESFIEHSDSGFPELRSPCHETIKMGADNPDNYYQNAPINPKYEYRITGTRGTVDYLGISAVVNSYGSAGSMVTDGFLDSNSITVDANGQIDIIISQQEQPGDWLSLGTNTNAVNVRQTFKDRTTEKAAELRIERILAADSRPEPLTPEKMNKALHSVTTFLTGATNMFEDWSESFIPFMNQLPAADQAYCQLIGGDPNIFYFHSAWEIADDEVLVLHAERIPECQTWNFQLDNWWMESLDYRYHTIHINKHTAVYDEDGGVTIVISHTKPPHSKNWVETAGHNIGTMCWRWIGASDHPPVAAKVVKFADL
ncbi:MAG: hypothetical protein ACI8UP_005415 [Porticoccaceae bacterium]|jgi:hypothetical protein